MSSARGQQSGTSRAWRRFLTEPTFHFAVLGALLFGIYPLVAPARLDAVDTAEPVREVVVDAARIQGIVDAWTEAWQQPPTPTELDQLVEEEVRSAVLAREATILGLDRDDEGVRTLLREKMELVAENSGSVDEPTDADLQAFYEANKQKLGGGLKLSFEQVRLDPARRGVSLQHDAAMLLATLRADDGKSLDPAALGDPSAQLPGELTELPETDVAGLFGSEFAQRLATVELDQWTGPIASNFGQHLVRVTERMEPAVLLPSELREMVRGEWLTVRAQARRDQVYQALRERYRIVVERPKAPTAATAATAATAGSPGAKQP
jgi:hypothetical protein